ncbi:DUF4089 domain-containing protein [Roseomonas fluvialis]|nr:DUF4089 domain-containing protein [Roseomonas fluvialis]
MPEADPEAIIAALLPATGIPVDPAWRVAIAANLRIAGTIAEALKSFPLPDEVEPAPIFEPGR